MSPHGWYTCSLSLSPSVLLSSQCVFIHLGLDKLPLNESRFLKETPWSNADVSETSASICSIWIRSTFLLFVCAGLQGRAASAEANVMSGNKSVRSSQVL